MTFARGLFTFVLMTALAIIVADFLALRDQSNEPGIAKPPRWLPGTTYTLHKSARHATQLWGTQPDAATALIRRSTERYPLDSGNWLALARIEAARNGRQSHTLSADLAAAVSVRPFKRSDRWQAAQIALHSGDLELAERHLRQWVKGEPSSTRQALLIGRRWLSDPDQLIDALVPVGDDYLAQAMHFAYQQRDTALADAVWQRIQNRINLNDPVFLDYFDFLLDRGLTDQAVAMWAEHDPYFRSGNVPNGDFSRDLGPGRGLNWQLGRLPAGIRVFRDESEFYYRPASLRIDFDGNENVDLRVPWIQIPVQPGKAYTLHGYWRGEGLTTRSLPYLTVLVEGSRGTQRIEVPRGDFDWSIWSTNLQVPEDGRFIRLRLRRNSSNAFDRYIAGSIWLDGIMLDELSGQEADSLVSRVEGHE
jgi:hypothetical protein